MWVSHFAPGLVLSRYSPQTPLSLLTFAGALPDFTFFVLALLGIEGIQYSDKSEQLGYRNPTGGKGSSCFPYDCDYPYSHSFIGEVVLGLLFAAGVTYLRKLPLSSFVTLLLASQTHFFLDVAVHRHDVALTPDEPPSSRHGFPILDYPIVVFISDLGLFLAALFIHAKGAAPSSQGARQTAARAYLVAAAVATVIQADFAFLGAPTKEARWVHGPIFAFEILGIAYGLGRMGDIAGEGHGRTPGILSQARRD